MEFNNYFYKTSGFWFGLLFIILDFKVPVMLINGSLFTTIVHNSEYSLVIDIILFVMGVCSLVSSFLSKEKLRSNN